MRLKSVIIFLLLGFLMLNISLAQESLESFDKENTLIYGEFKLPTTLDPITSNNPVSMRICELLFDGLVGFNEKGEVIPKLAEKWEISPNGLLYTFELRKDVLWHDGHPFTARDVKFTFDLIMHPKTQTALKSNLSFIASARIIDEYKIRFILKNVVYNAIGRFSFKIIPQHRFIKPYLTRDDPFVWEPIGTGPYYLYKVSNEGWIVLKAFENYYGGKPKIENIIMRNFLDRNLMTEALLVGAIDVIPSVQTTDIGRIKSTGNFYLIPYNSLSYSFFAYNFRNIHLKDRKVRLALTYAVDRKKMLNTFFQGKGQIISGPFAPGSYSYNPNVKPYPYSPQKAKKLLREAGYRDRDRDGILEKYGKPLKLRLIANISDRVMKRVCVAYQDYLKQIGVDVALEFLDRFAWEKAIFETHNFDIALGSWIFDEASDITSLFHSAYQGPYQNNFIAYHNPLVDQLLTEFSTTLDPETRRSINYKLHEIIHKDCPYTFLWTLTRYAAFNKRVRNMRIDPYTFFADINQWYLETSE